MLVNKVLLAIILATCELGEGYADGFKSPSLRDISGIGPNSLSLQVAKRQGKGYTDFNDNEIEDIVKRHNFHRSNTRPSASNMKHMTWDSKLATMSQKWADTCVYEHGGKDGSSNITPFWGVGQNLALGSYPESSSGVYVTDKWYEEEEFYTYGSDTCRPGEQCGHYTQVVWADSYTVGCGRKLCSNVWVQTEGEWWTDVYYIVCDYGPTGNVRGQITPFATGERCSACPDDAVFCTDNSLCRDCTRASKQAACGECSRNCENCGTLDAISCSCQCAPGWDGSTCSEPCADHHDWCGASPGWYGPKLCYNTEYSEDVRKYCLKMCGICLPEDSSFVCRGNGGGSGGGGNGNGGGGGGGEGTEPAVKNTKYCKTAFTATSVINGNLFVFKKDKYWMFDDIKNGNLQTSAGGDLVRDAFPKVNPDVRAVYQRPDNKVLFMRGAKYWLYTKKVGGWTRDNGFPKDISQTFPNLPSPTAAMYDNVDGKTYFFSGANFWRYDEGQQRFDIERQPISSMFNGVPSKISGAFINDNSDYILVKGRDFWLVRRGQRTVSSDAPKSLALKYLNCSDE